MVSKEQVYDFYELCRTDNAKILTLGKLGSQIARMLKEVSAEYSEEAQKCHLQMFKHIETITYLSPGTGLKAALVRYCDKPNREREQHLTNLIIKQKDILAAFEARKALRSLEEIWQNVKSFPQGDRLIENMFIEWFDTAFAPLKVVAGKTDADKERVDPRSHKESREALQVYAGAIDTLSAKTDNELAKAKLKELKLFLDSVFEQQVVPA